MIDLGRISEETKGLFNGEIEDEQGSKRQA